MQTDLVAAAVIMARHQSHLRQQAIFHSDRGSQYTSTMFQALCAELQMTPSMCAVGTCWDNAMMEKDDGAVSIQE